MRGENGAFVALCTPVGAQRDKGSADASISHLAANQHGVVSAAQLERAGIRRRGRGRRVAASHLHPIHRGVYAVGHRKLSSEGRWMAAVLASGEGAVLSHTSAAELWGIWHRYRSAGSDEPVPVHTSVPTTAGKRQRTGIVLHRSSSLIARHCTRRDGIPVTTPARTLADVRSLLSPAQFASAIR